MFPNAKCDSGWRTFSTGKCKSHCSKDLDGFLRFAPEIQRNKVGVLWAICESVWVEPLQQNPNAAEGDAEDERHCEDQTDKSEYTYD